MMINDSLFVEQRRLPLYRGNCMCRCGAGATTYDAKSQMKCDMTVQTELGRI